MADLKDEDILRVAREVVKHEAKTVSSLADVIGAEFLQAVKLIRDSNGRVILTGIGKSGHIAQKVASTLTSIGTVAGYLHPAEGFHGDLGIVRRGDILIAISNSGETNEILELIPPLKKIGVPIIAITGNKTSSLARRADVHLYIGDVRESDPDNLIPTASSVATLALCDALVVALMKLTNFKKEDFAFIHPRGMLGKKLTLKVVDLLQGEASNPKVHRHETFHCALKAITHHKLGGVSVIDDEGKLCGIITDGDVRRLMEKWKGTVEELMNTKVEDIMTKTPTYIHSDELAIKALELMENHKPRPIFLLPVVDDSRKPVGMLHIHDLVQAGFKISMEEFSG